VCILDDGKGDVSYIGEPPDEEGDLPTPETIARDAGCSVGIGANLVLTLNLINDESQAGPCFFLEEVPYEARHASGRFAPHKAEAYDE
jgi:hypothetical protein